MSDIDHVFEDDDEDFCLEDEVPSNLTVKDEYDVYLAELRRAIGDFS